MYIMLKPEPPTLAAQVRRVKVRELWKDGKLRG